MTTRNLEATGAIRDDDRHVQNTDGSETTPTANDAVSQALNAASVEVVSDGNDTTSDDLLSARQRWALERTARRLDTYGRRARALLALDRGVTQAEAGLQAGLAPRTVRYWLFRLRKEGLAILPAEVLKEVGALETPPAPAAETDSPKHNPKGPGIKLDDTMAEAARKTLRYHFEKMLDKEEDTRDGDDIEDLHDMRVATRRMRSALRLFKPYVDWPAIKPYNQGIKRTASRLGSVRDLDVYHEKLARYIASKKSEHRPNLDPLFEAWQNAHDRARAELLDYLGSDRYQTFKEDFTDFLAHPFPAPSPVQEDGTVDPQRIRDVIPAAIYDRLAAVRAYDGWILQSDTPLERYHCLRIAIKRLRYAVEFFIEVLGPEAEEVIEHAKVAQDHLGDLQDAIVAIQKLRNFWMWGTLSPPKKGRVPSLDTLPVIAPDVAIYHADRQAEITTLLEAFPEIWRWFHEPTISLAIARAVSLL